MELKHIQEEILQDLAFKPDTEWAEAERLHISTCPECQESLEAYQLVFSELSTQADFEFSASFEANILDQIPELNTQPGLNGTPVPQAEGLPIPQSSDRTPWWQWGGIAAAAAAGIGFVFYFFLGGAESMGVNITYSDGIESAGSRFADAFSFVQGNEILIAAGIFSFASIFLLDRMLNRQRNRDFISE